ncbi:hypothetical protein [Micromonospora sp. NBC_01813]|uniref:hypothetical protein n=1 Tax=Micromonospora sp. NBC_01813 TaxID=2975988 RepID=UPI002DD9931D|nr:hypothetical protein [Micromonospora sp. NBC_01813]WSA11096.1 hypothetical protein OG958_10180 [Micromonospora sp. NBC_01813]
MSVRRSLAAAGAGLTVAVAGAVLVATPAQAADVFVDLNPSTVESGYLVGIRASCTDNTAPATVESDAFGTVEVRPQFDELTAAVTVPAGTEAGSYRVRLTCPDDRSATTTLYVLDPNRPSRGPATGFGGTAGGLGSGGPDAGALLAGVGAAALAAGAVLGVLTLRRRRVS